MVLTVASRWLHYIMFSQAITRRDYIIYVKGGKPKFVNICWEKIGDKYEILVRSTVHVFNMQDQMYKWAVSKFANGAFDEIKDNGGHKVYWTKERSFEFSSHNSTFYRIIVRTPNNKIDFELRELDNFASKFGLVTHFSNETYWEGWRNLESGKSVLRQYTSVLLSIYIIC